MIIAGGVAWPSQDFVQKNNMGDESQSRSLQIERRWTSSSRARHKVTKSQTGGEVQLQDSGSSQEPATDWLAIIKVTQQQSAKTVDEQILYYRNWQQYPKHELKTLYLIFLSVISQEASGQSLSISWLRPIYARFLLWRVSSGGRASNCGFRENISRPEVGKSAKSVWPSWCL